jgi:Glutathione S-transferase
MAARTRFQAEEPLRVASNASITLYVAADDPVGDWLRLVLLEKDIDSATVRVLRPGMVDEDFLVLNPAHSLPTLADREGVLTIPTVIAEYLDERYPHPPLMPISPGARARVRSQVQHLVGELFPLLGERSNPGSGRMAPPLATALQALARSIGRGSSPTGQDFTLAETAWTVLLHHLRDSQPTWPPALQRYAGGLFERLAYRRTLA